MFFIALLLQAPLELYSFSSMQTRGTYEHGQGRSLVEAKLGSGPPCLVREEARRPGRVLEAEHEAVALVPHRGAAREVRAQEGEPVGRWSLRGRRGGGSRGGRSSTA